MQDVVALVLLSIPGSLATLPSVATDTVRAVPVPVVAPVPIPAALLPDGVGLAGEPLALQDTTKRKRTTAVEYSSFYNTRLTIHQVLSWTMLPLFALQYASGSQILEYGDAAPDWAKDVHAPGPPNNSCPLPTRAVPPLAKALTGLRNACAPAYSSSIVPSDGYQVRR